MQRTRRTLREALLALLLERGWDAVTVQDVCERADVGRSTFYTHFADKEELLAGGLDDLKAGLRHSLAPAEPGHPLPFLHGLLQHAGENQRLFRALVGKRSGEAVLKRFRGLLLELVREDLAAGSQRTFALAREPTAQFIAGGLVQLLAWWLDGRPPLPTPEIEAQATSFVTAVLRAARR